LVGTTPRFSEPPVGGLPLGHASGLAAWQRLVERLRAGQIQTLLVYEADPVHGLPAALGFEDALLQAGQVVSFSSLPDDTTLQADLLLPAHLPLEDWGSVVAEDAGVLTIQQPVVPPFYDTRGFGDTLLALASAVQQPLPWGSMKEVVAELQAGAADPPRYWTQLLQAGFLPAAGELSPSQGSSQDVQVNTGPSTGAADYPYALLPFGHNTLGAGEGAHLPWLQAAPDPITSVVWQTWVELNPREAATLGLAEGDVVGLESSQGRIEVPVYLNPAAPPGVLAVPFGQGHQAGGRWASQRGANPMALLEPIADAASGALAYAATRVRLVKTGRHVPLPKFEGSVPAYQLPGQEVAKVSRG
jgi:anaerobic selenocysteine-containing dehydrogenase